MRNFKFVLLVMALLFFTFQTMAQECSTGFLSDLTQVKKGRSKAVTSSDPDFNSNYDRRTYIEPGETMVLCDIEGPAIINHIWLTFNDARPNWLEKDGSARPDEIVLRMYWVRAIIQLSRRRLGIFSGQDSDCTVRSVRYLFLWNEGTVTTVIGRCPSSKRERSQ